MTPIGTKFVRAVTFLDRAPEDPRTVPVHVAAELLLDDEPTAARINLPGGWSVSDSGDSGTVVSFLVHPDDVELGEIDPETHEVTRWPTISGRPVLPPRAHPWETVHVRTPFDTQDWVRVFIFARTAKALPAPTQEAPAPSDPSMFHG